MNTIYLHKFAPAIVMNDMDILNKDIDELVRLGSPFVLDFDGIKGIEMEAAAVLSEKLRNKYGLNYRQQVKFVNMTPLVRNAFLFSEPVNELSAKPSIPTRRFSSAFSRVFAAILLFLTLGVGQMWANVNCSLGEAYLKCNFNGSSHKFGNSGNDSDYEYTYNSNNHSAYNLGTLTSETFTVTYISWHCWNNWDSDENTTSYFWYYKNDGTNSSATTTIDQQWNGHGDFYPKKENQTIQIASATDASGNYTFHHGWYTKFYEYNSSSYTQKDLNNGGSFQFTYTILPPSVSSFSVAEANHLSGSGTSEDPYILPYNGTLALTISGSQEHTDANSSAQYYNTSSNDTWTTTATKSVSGITSTTETSVTVKMRYHNNTASLDGAENSATIYYKAEPAYTVTVNNDEHGTTDPSGEQSNVGQLTGIAVTATPTTGYRFNTWAISGSGSFTSALTTASNTFKPTAASTITASFTPNTTTITLDKGAHGAANQTATVSYDATALTSITHVAANGMYELTGYFTDGGVKVLNADGSFAGSTVIGYITSNKWSNANAAVNLYAHWDAVSTYSVSYNAGGGTGTMSANTGITAGGSQTISANSFTRSGYTFSHWTANVAVTANKTAVAAGGTIAASATLSNITSNIALTAQWTENNYTVTVTAGSNGTVASSSVTGHMDTKVTLPTATANTGYHFSTWTTVTGTVSYDNQTSATAAKVYGLSAAATVRADFDANTYSVVFNANGGTGSMSNEAFTYDASAKALTSNSFTRLGYTFLGWATSTEKASALTVDYTDGESVSNLTSANEGTFNLYAVWARKYYIGGRLQHDWEDGSSTTNEMTYVSDGRYKFETNKTVNELSVQWHNVSGNYNADQVFFIHTGSGKNGSSSNPFYTTPNEDGAGLNFETSNAYANALVLANQETNWGSIVQNRCVQFSNTDNLSSNVVIWWEPSTKKIWYTATESLNTNYYLLGFGAGNWTETEARRFTVASVNATTATVSVALLAQTYTNNTDNGFKVKNGSTSYGNNGTMTRANCSGWVFATDLNNCGITADVAGTYTFTLDMSTKAVSVTYPTETGYNVTTSASAGGTVDAASYTAYEFTTTAISATPNTGYYFTGWEATDGSVTFANASSASTTINGVTAAAAIKANFAPKWVIAGGDSQTNENGDDVMGNWSTSANLITNIGTNANSKDTGYVEITLPANTTFYFKVKDRTQDSDHGWYGNTGTMTYAANNKQGWDMSTDVSNNCGITTAGAGTYKFAWNFTDNKVTVHYPTSYTVTFGYGTGGSAVTASGSTSGSITSGQYVASGEDVTFTQTPASGYTFNGWYTTSDGNTAVTGMGVSDPVLDDITANATVYAQYTEDMHTVTVLAGTHGTITTPIGGSGETVSAGIATSAAIVAEVADYGYYFQGWTVESGTATIADASALSTTVTATSDATIKANFVSHWTIAGGDTESANGSDAMGDWSTVANGIDNFTEVETDVWVGYADIDLPANTTFYFKVRDLYDGEAWYGNTGEMTYTDYENWSMTKNTSNCRITTAGKGTYRFTWNEKNKTLTVTYPTSYTVAYSVYTFLGDDESNSESTTGGSISSVVDGDDIALTSGKYVVSNGTAVFTHSTPTTNYHFDGWYSDAACETAYVNGEGGATIGENTLTLGSLTADKTVYAKFQENMTTVTLAHTGNGSIKIGDNVVTSTTVGAVTTRTLVPVADPGYYFAGWTKTSGTDYSISDDEDDEDNTTITLTGGGLGETTGQTLTANFVELEKVYFRNWNADANEPLWDNVYVYFSISYDGNYAKSNGSSEYSGILMTQEGTSNVYWAYVPRGTTRYNYADDTNNANSNNDIAFSNHDFGTNNGNGYTFYEYEAVMRGDYKTEWNMFVPQHGNFTDQNTNSTKYYNGYWKHHNVAVGSDAGYRIERYNGSGYVDPADNGDGSEHHRDFTVTSENTIQYQLRVDNLTSGHNNYMIYNVGGTHYITFDSSPVETGYTITNTDCSNIGLSEYKDGSPHFYITPTSEGIYTLTIDMTGDVMRLSVNYPVAVGDYMLVHTYNDGSAKKSRSDIIKSTEVSKRRYSMFIDNKSAHSPSLVLKKCTSLSDGNPVWDAGKAVSMTGFGTAGGFTADTAGVFVFDVAINNDAATLSYIEPYRGSYYIKTDCADGGWTAYKNNVMDLNTITFDTSDPQAYDYLYCKWVDNTAAGKNVNVKCVIANDYCIAVSDTLTDDNILGTGVQTLPYNANVRFSYNSTSNQLKRAYINGSSTATDRYLVMVGDDKLLNRDGSAIHWAGLNANEVTFTDRNNWIYIVNLQAQSGAEVYITANYNDKVQNLVGSETAKQTVLTTTAGGETKYNICAVYDFKTNKLVTAWRPGGAISETLNIETDVMIMRTNNTKTEEITFGAGGSIPDKKTVYALIEFDKATLTASTPRTQRSIYWIGFPFDVKLSDAFGFGIYGKHWIMQYYDGAERAAKGQWADSPTRWKYITPAMREEGYVLKANVGYVLKLDLDELGAESKVWDNSVTLLDIYFPSKEKVAIDDDLPTSMEVPAHPCSITRDRRDIWDSNWNLIAVPSFANVNGLNKVTPTVEEGVEIDNGSSPNALSFYYNYDGSTNSFGVADAKLTTFNTMFAYMVQYAGTLNWSERPASMPAARRADSETEKDSYTLDLHVSQAGNAADHTFVRLQDNATESYDLNIDLVKAENAGITNLYTIVEGVSMGANCLPVPATTTTVPVGIDAAAAAEYTFSLPEGTDGMNVSLIDYETGITTNLALGDYTIALGKGTYKERFALVINRRQVTTDIEAAEGDMLTTGCEKVIIDGTLYLRKDGRVYDAQGKLVR